MTRKDLQEIALIRLNDAKVLLEKENYDGAYYLCGYVVECGLKACIAKQTKKYDFPDQKATQKSYTHNLTQLRGAAGLNSEFNKATKNCTSFNTYWATVKDWTTKSRYEKHSQKEAQDIFSAITNEEHGVLKWIKQHW